MTSSFFTARDTLLRLSSDPERARAEFTLPDVGPSFNWAHDVFDVIANGNDTVALWISEEDGSEQKLTFKELSRRSDQLANWMRSLGMQRGDVAMIMLGNQVELWEIMLASLKLGVVILPTSVVLGPQELIDRVTRGNVKWVFACPDEAMKFSGIPSKFHGIGVGLDGASKDHRAALWEWARYEESRAASVARIPKQTASEDTALLYFTSGTTNLPKIVVHSHTSYPVGHLTTMAWLGVRPGDTHSVVSAPGWAKHAWSSFFAPWHVGATVFVPNHARFNGSYLVSELERAGVTGFCAPPTVWRMLIQEQLDVKPAALREVVSAGEPLNPEVIARIKEWWGVEIRDGYGQTEMTAAIGNMPGDPIDPGAMGKPLPGIDIALLAPLTGEAADEGEICLPLGAEHGGTAHSSPVSLMSGYYGNPEATAASQVGGFYHTGDVAQRAEGGTLTFIGRTDDIFKSSDFKVSPFEVESALLEHDLVAEAAVVGAPDETRLNVTKAYVALSADVPATAETARAILNFSRKALPPYMRVRRIEFFELPKTTSGKIRRIELRQREEAAFAAGERITTEWRESDFTDFQS